MRQINEVYLHCSGLPYGSFIAIDGYHKSNGWSGVWCPDRQRQIYCGYHWVVENAFPKKHYYTGKLVPDPDNQGKVIRIQNPVYLNDGRIIKGRPESEKGSHVQGRNTNSIGIAYIGVQPSACQLIAIKNLLQEVLKRYKLSIDNVVLGHYEVFGTADERSKLIKTCPNIRMELIRNLLKGGE